MVMALRVKMLPLLSLLLVLKWYKEGTQLYENILKSDRAVFETVCKLEQGIGHISYIVEKEVTYLALFSIVHPVASRENIGAGWS